VTIKTNISRLIFVLLFGASCDVREGILVAAPADSCYDFSPNSPEKVDFFSCMEANLATSAPHKLSWRLEAQILRDLAGTDILSKIRNTNSTGLHNNWCAYVRERLAQSQVREAFSRIVIHASMTGGHPTCSYVLEQFGRQSESAYVLVGTNTVYFDYFVVPTLAKFDPDFLSVYIRDRVFLSNTNTVSASPDFGKFFILRVSSFLSLNIQVISIYFLVFTVAISVGYYLNRKRT